MTTPTPGDLSARLQALSDACLSRRLTPAECGEFHDCIAALSALPAAGGWTALVKSWRERADKMLPTSGVDTHWHEGARDGMNQCASEAERLLPTTPQPSAAEPKCGCGRPGEYESKDGPACNKYFRCKDAAVGAQGDGGPNTFDCEHAHAARMCGCGFCRALNIAAPAAGKGVDDTAALAEFTEYFVKNYPGPHTIISDPNWHAPRIFRAAKRALSALTRQPVAGDGMVLVPRELVLSAAMVGTKLYTTPQPSAAEELGPHPLNICPTCKDYYMDCECPPDAAVGAQGEAEELARWLDAKYSRHREDEDRRAAALIRRLATPAAGKGADAELVADMLGDLVYDDGYGEKSRSCYTVEAIKEQIAALTRQPVAGDGMQKTTATDIDIAFHNAMQGLLYGKEETRDAYHWFELGWKAAPAATPTDGGKGHS